MKPGEVTAVIGKSGSGKTTLAYCLSGIIPHRIHASISGEVRVNGIDILSSSFTEVVKNVNVVLEDYESQIFGLTVEEDIVFGLENLNIPNLEIRERLECVLELFNLRDRQHALISELSGGLKQRLAIASVVALKPKFLILDNPTSNLDWPGVKGLSKAIAELKRHGCGIVLFLRKLKGLENVVDKLFLLEEGVLKPGALHTFSTLPSSRVSSSGGGRLSPIIKVEDVWFRYDGPWVLKSVTLEVCRGEVLAVMGRNGSGKTTLMKLLNGLLKPTKGEVLIDGKSTRRTSSAEVARIVGLAFQDPSKHLFAETVWDEVSFGCRNLGLPLENAERALQLLELTSLRDKPVYKLSMGEKVRTVIASALALNPQVLILDEPTTGQDESVLRELASIIGEAKRLGKSIVVVTHDSEFALAVADRVAVLVDGRVRCIGEAESVLLNEQILEEAGLEPPLAEYSCREVQTSCCQAA
ncbi:MAG: ATP-binding cassette domain-containing protein [Candidatus Verstraetearchaeota archaeon]|nr:ATP-binding cassette domain-containing protein [Candidatus Verstraetearchaeota archaeon]